MTDASDSHDYLDGLERSTTSPRLLDAIGEVRRAIASEASTTTVTRYGLRLRGSPKRPTPLGDMDREWADQECADANAEDGMAGKWELVQRTVTTGPWEVAP